MTGVKPAAHPLMKTRARAPADRELLDTPGAVSMEVREDGRRLSVERAVD